MAINWRNEYELYKTIINSTKISINPMIQQQRMMIRYDWEIDLNVYDERHYNKNTLKAAQEG